jgi:PPOX class probable F420-dependent enzyme
MHRLVAEARVGRLATAGAGGIHLVPFCYVLADGWLYSAVDGKAKRGTALRRVSNLRGNPAASVLVDHYDEDWQALWWVRMEATGTVIDGLEGAEPSLALLRRKYPQYASVALGPPVIALRVTRWTGWSARPSN